MRPGCIGIGQLSEVRLWDSEDAFDAVRTSDSNLNMCFGIKARPGIHLLSFGEHRPHRVNKAAALLVDRLQMLDDGTIKLAAETATVQRQHLSRRHKGFSKRAISCPHNVNANRTHEIKAPTEVQDCANNGRHLDLGPRSRRCLNRKVEATLWISLPEIYAPPQPVVIVLASLERSSGKQPLSYSLITAMVAKDEAG